MTFLSILLLRSLVRIFYTLKKINNPHSQIVSTKKTSSFLNWFLSGWQDSNLRPPRPKRGAITGLRYTPMRLSKFFNSVFSTEFSGETGIRTLGTLVRVRRFSKPFLSATQAPLLILLMNFARKRLQMYIFLIL